MKVLRKTPGAPAGLIEIENTLEALQAEVGGYIETVTIAEDCIIICNEEGWLMDLPINVTIGGMTFLGPILVVSSDGEEFADVDVEVAQNLLPELWIV